MKNTKMALTLAASFFLGTLISVGADNQSNDNTKARNPPAKKKTKALAGQPYVGFQAFSRLKDWDWNEESLNLELDQQKLGCRIIAYRIKWWNGIWSDWYAPGVNDLFQKKGKSVQRRWAAFKDHEFEIIYRAPKKIDFSKKRK